MYELVLTLHSWIRWAAILAGIVATVTALTSTPRSVSSDRSDTWGLVLMIALDLQLLLGLLLYVALSPITAAIFDDFGGAMRNPSARFWAVEHVSMMILAVVLAHVGRVLGRKASTPSSRRTRQLVCFGLATILMIVGTPWPGLRAGRELFRFGV
jgi:heme A synthase